MIKASSYQSLHRKILVVRLVLNLEVKLAYISYDNLMAVLKLKIDENVVQYSVLPYSKLLRIVGNLMRFQVCHSGFPTKVAG